jgi:hypothetical protein
MDWIRSAIGIQTAAPPVKKPNSTLERYRRDAEHTSHEERSEKFARAQMMRMQMLKEELKDEEADVKAAVARKDRVAAQHHLTRAKKVRLELQTLQKKHDNMMQTQGAIQNANSNVAQGLLVQESAAELESAVHALEEIDLDGAMDTLQDSAAIMEEQDTRLTEPIFGSNIDVEYEVDDELDRLMQEQEERDALAATSNLPDVVLPSAGGNSGGTAVKAEQEDASPHMEEIQEIKN